MLKKPCIDSEKSNADLREPFPHGEETLLKTALTSVSHLRRWKGKELGPTLSIRSSPQIADANQTNNWIPILEHAFASWLDMSKTPWATVSLQGPQSATLAPWARTARSARKRKVQSFARPASETRLTANSASPKMAKSRSAWNAIRELAAPQNCCLPEQRHVVCSPRKKSHQESVLSQTKSLILHFWFLEMNQQNCATSSR